MNTIINMVQKLMEWVDDNGMKVFMILVIMLGIASGVSLLGNPGGDFVFTSLQEGPAVALQWTCEPNGATLWEIQGRQYEGEWNTFMYSANAFLRIMIPSGVVQFRVRPWTIHGPGKWSPATQHFIFIMPPQNPRGNSPPKVLPAIFKL